MHPLIIISTIVLLLFNSLNQKTGTATYDIVPVHINIGKGADCFSRGQLCSIQSSQEWNNNRENEIDATGIAFFNNNKQLTIELDTLLTPEIITEIADDFFTIEKDFTLSPGLTNQLKSQSPPFTIQQGTYKVTKTRGQKHQIVFSK